jgi:hypothetical protein
MMDEFVKMLQKRKREQGNVDEGKLKAKAGAMKELSDMLGKDLSEGMKGLKKVTVASNSDEGLMEGLEKAEDVLEKKSKSSEDNMEEESDSENNEEKDMEDEEEMESDEDMSDAEKKIAELEAEIRKLKSKA